MTAVILAAGIGRRMHPLSDTCHKALLPIGDATILGRTLDALRSHGVDDIVIVTGHRAADIRAFVAERFRSLAVRFVHNERFASTNNIVSLSLAIDALSLDQDVLLIECDLLFEPEVLGPLFRPGRGNVALLDRYRAGMDGTVVSVEDEVITGVYPPHLQGPNFSYADKFKTLNIYRFDRDFCRSTLRPLLSCYANLIDGNCYYELVLGMLVNMQRQRIEAEIVPERSWAEVDDPNDLASARFQFEPQSRPAILDRAFGGHWNFGLTDFSYLANVHFPTDAMVAAMRQALPDLLRSYGSSQPILNEKLAYVCGGRAERIQALHGASQIYPLLPELVGDRPVLIPAPTFGEYPRVLPRAGCYPDVPGIELDAVEAMLPKDGVLVVVNPNSPTGTVVATDAIWRIATTRPDVLLLVDESFLPFSSEPSLIRRLEADPLPNVAVLTSLSKSMGVPGLRLGFLYSANARLLQRVGGALPVWNLSSLAEFFLELLLKYRSEFDESLRRTRRDRDEFADLLRQVPVVEEVYPSGGNFLLVRLAGGDPIVAAALRTRLLTEQRIEIKDVSAKMGKMGSTAPFLRLAVRGAEDNARLAAALADSWVPA